MKKLLLVIVAFALTFSLAACAGEELPELPDEVTMANVDDYLARPDVQYVDLRNFDEKMKNGYIEGFEVIPFFDYLEETEILVRTDGNWEFAAEDLKSPGALEDLFNKDKVIFLMCGSGTRAEFVLEALESLDYTVYNVGGFADYDGAYLVTGDGVYENVVDLPALPAEVTMSNIDMYLNRPDVQYVDLRNFDEFMKNGFVEGFVSIPFFDYLEHEDILVRTDGNWEFAAEDIVSQGGLRGLFNADKTIFLMCGSGTRAGYVQDALESLGYTVFNVGGFADYDGDFEVLGDGSYDIDVNVEGDYTPGTYYGIDPIGGYQAVVIINNRGGIGYVMFDALQGNTTKQNLGFDYGMGAVSGREWFEHADALAAKVVADQGWDDIDLIENFDPTWNALTVGHHFIEFDGLAGVTVGAEGFVLAWNAAIAQASDSDLGVVDIDTTPEMWAAAHDPAFDYADGVYFGMDEAHGYYVKVTVEDGFITDVFFDALYDVYLGCDVDGTFDDQVAKADCGDVATETPVYEETTKQVLGTDYGMGAITGKEWYEHANELAAAILDAQEWDADWVIIPGTDGGHDKFDTTDTDTADAVGGVTVGIEGFKTAWDEAIAQAVPTT
jgi:rhodanese-related sulfurtransferase